MHDPLRGTPAPPEPPRQWLVRTADGHDYARVEPWQGGQAAAERAAREIGGYVLGLDTELRIPLNAPPVADYRSQYGPQQPPAPSWRCTDPDLTPAAFSALYTAAAAAIRNAGYDGATATGDYEGSHGISITAALRTAAEHHAASSRPGGIYGTYTAADTADLTGDLELRLAAVLYLTGQLTRRTHIGDLADTVAGWEGSPFFDGPACRYRTQDEALTVLATAAAMLATITT
jgi:hypothetical protein